MTNHGRPIEDKNNHNNEEKQFVKLITERRFHIIIIKDHQIIAYVGVGQSTSTYLRWKFEINSYILLKYIGKVHKIIVDFSSNMEKYKTVQTFHV